MPKYVLKIVAALLAGCLVADPALAGGNQLTALENLPVTSTSFASEALVGAPVHFISYLLTSGKVRVAASLLGAALSTSFTPSAAQPPASARWVLEAPAQSQLQDYFSKLRALSVGTWKNARPDVYLQTNESLHHEFFEALQGRGGVMMGVSLQQNLDFIVHGHPSYYVLLDINPVVTEVMIPALGRLMERYPTRRQFLSHLAGMELTDAEIAGLVEPKRKHPQGKFASQNQWHEYVSHVAARQPDGHADEILWIFDHDILPFLSLSPEQVNISHTALEWLSSFGVTGLNDFLNHHVRQSWHMDVDEKDDIATWLNSEENYQTIRSFWLQGRLLGVSGDIRGSSLERVGNHFRALGEKFSMVYVSNIPDYLFRMMSEDGRQLVLDNFLTLLGQLPLREDALYLYADEKLYGHVLPFPAEKRSSGLAQESPALALTESETGTWHLLQDVVYERYVSIGLLGAAGAYFWLMRRYKMFARTRIRLFVSGLYLASSASQVGPIYLTYKFAQQFHGIIAREESLLNILEYLTFYRGQSVRLPDTVTNRTLANWLREAGAWPVEIALQVVEHNGRRHRLLTIGTDALSVRIPRWPHSTSLFNLHTHPRFSMDPAAQSHLQSEALDLPSPQDFSNLKAGESRYLTSQGILLSYSHGKSDNPGEYVILVDDKPVRKFLDKESFEADQSSAVLFIRSAVDDGVNLIEIIYPNGDRVKYNRNTSLESLFNEAAPAYAPQQSLSLSPSRLLQTAS